MPRYGLCRNFGALCRTERALTRGPVEILVIDSAALPVPDSSTLLDPRRDFPEFPNGIQVLILASASPRRADLLRAAGIDADVRPADVDESLHPAESPDRYACRVAREKALAVSRQAPGRFVLGADTVVVVDDLILGKPGDQADARRMLRLLSGRRHDVITGVALVAPDGASGHRVDSRAEITAVEFTPLSTSEIEWYVATGEPMDKAGAYAIQGLASRFVTRVEGSYSNVVGLPIALVYQMCTEAGLLLS
jgi:septum formation protein